MAGWGGGAAWWTSAHLTRPRGALCLSAGEGGKGERMDYRVTVLFMSRLLGELEREMSSSPHL